VDERLGSLCVSGILCIKTFSPTLVPVIICASINFNIRHLTIILVKLHKPLRKLTLRSSIIGDPTFSSNSWGGNPGNVMVFKYSVGILAFTSFAVAFFGHTIAFSWRDHAVGVLSIVSS
ncbi:hypothetical protein Tco_0246567, partial [Tanacetum coccineum]